MENNAAAHFNFFGTHPMAKSQNWIQNILGIVTFFGLTSFNTLLGDNSNARQYPHLLLLLHQRLALHSVHRRHRQHQLNVS